MGGGPELGMGPIVGVMDPYIPSMNYPFQMALNIAVLKQWGVILTSPLYTSWEDSPK